MKKITLFTLIVLGCFLAACAPTPAEIQLSIAQTQTASLPSATVTPLPSATPEPGAVTATASAGTISPEQQAGWFTFEQTINSLITAVDGVRIVHWVNLADGIINIDFQTEWTAAENQPEAQFAVIKQLAGFCSNTMADQIKAYTGVDKPSIRITTQSVDERYEFESLTTFDQCVHVAFGDLNYKDWQTQAGVKQLK